MRLGGVLFALLMAAVVRWVFLEARGFAQENERDPLSIFVDIFDERHIGHAPAPPADRQIRSDEDRGRAALRVREYDPQDPLVRFIQRYLPFTLREEEEAVAVPEKATLLGGDLWRRLTPYHDFIMEASNRFDVPPEIIAAVIILESGGDADARNPRSSATGLMQLVRGTYQEMRRKLNSEGINIMADATDPYSNIMAGTAYLSKCFEEALWRHPRLRLQRGSLEDWDIPLRYYFAGPNYESLRIREVGPERERILVYSDNTRVSLRSIEGYSAKARRFARFIKRSV